jgi:hypothetical protein
VTATKTCSVCGQQIAAEAIVCPNDQSFQYGMSPVDVLAQQTAAQPPVDRKSPASTEPQGEGRPTVNRGWTCPSCGTHNADEPWCDCGTFRPTEATAGGPAPQTGPGIVVRMPNGKSLTLCDGDVVELGRHSPAATVAAALADYDGVGRRHATVSVSGNHVTVVDHASINGTRVNGVPVQDFTTLPLAALLTIQLGRYAVVHVSLASGAGGA